MRVEIALIIRRALMRRLDHQIVNFGINVRRIQCRLATAVIVADLRVSPIFRHGHFQQSGKCIDKGHLLFQLRPIAQRLEIPVIFVTVNDLIVKLVG